VFPNVGKYGLVQVCKSIGLLHYHQCNVGQATDTQTFSVNCGVQEVLVWLWHVSTWTNTAHMQQFCKICTFKKNVTKVL